MGDRLATIDMGRKVAMGCCGGSWVTTGSPSNTMWPGPRPTSLPSGILLHPTVWPQYTNVTDRQADRRERGDRQRSPKNLEGYSISSEMTLFEGHICYFLSAFLHFAWVVYDAKCILVRASNYLFLAAFPHCKDSDVSWRIVGAAP